MCGIVGYKGSEDAASILFEGLTALEYRGYDSAGIATLDGEIEVRKDVGKVAEVDAKHDLTKLKGGTGIAHTRWATTGSVTKENAHPHVGKRFAIVHNGIVENYTELKKGLDWDFKTETDTEVILALIETGSGSTLERARDAFSKLHGRNAFVVMDGETGKLVAARKGSPLVLGISENGMILASDVSPVLTHTRDVVFIEDNEIMEIGDSWKCYGKDLAEKKKEVTKITWSVEQAQKGNFDHFMLKEIMEQKECIRDALAQDDELMKRVARMINEAFGTYVVGCGSAGKVALASTYIFTKVAKKHLNYSIGSEFPNYHDFLTPKSLLIPISQSGETADTLEALETVRDVGGKVVSMVNVLGSTMDRVSDETMPVHAGPEMAVCSTKAITNQLAITYLLAYAVDGRIEEGKKVLSKTADAVEEMLTEEYSRGMAKLASELKDCESMYLIGRGQNYPVALESAIKIQEVSYIHAEGFAAGELKHGPIALIDKGTPLIVFVPNDDTREDVIANALEVKARGGRIIGVAPENDNAFDDWIRVPDVPETSPIVNLIPIQLLAYHLAVAKGTDVDQPRNLAKSVTVK